MTNGQFSIIIQDSTTCFIYFISKWQINPFNTASYFAFTGTGSTRMSASSYLANMNTLNISPTKCSWKSVPVHIACHSLTKPRDNNKHYVAGTNRSQFLPRHFFCIMRLGSETGNSISFSFQTFVTLQRVRALYLSILWFSYKAKKRAFSNLCKPERGGLLVKFAT